MAFGSNAMLSRQCGILIVNKRDVLKVEKKSEGHILLDAKVGDIVPFGNYNQMDGSGSSKEPIKWKVLERNGSSLLLLSLFVLEYLPYHTTEEENLKWKHYAKKMSSNVK